MTAGFARGLALFLGLVLCAAGVQKVAAVETTRIALTRLLPSGKKLPHAVLTTASVGLGGLEMVIGALLVALPLTRSLAASALVLCVAFVLVVELARRRGVSCGCFESFSPKAAGPVERARSVVLLAQATAMCSLAWIAGRPIEPVGVALGVVAGAGATGAAIAGASRRETGRHRAWSGRPPSVAPAWRSVHGPRRRRLLSSARLLEAVRDVEDRAPGALHWRRARVSVLGGGAPLYALDVPGEGARLRVLVPRAGAAAVVCYTPKGVILPSPHGAGDPTGPALAPAPTATSARPGS